MYEVLVTIINKLIDVYELINEILKTANFIKLVL